MQEEDDEDDDDDDDHFALLEARRLVGRELKNVGICKQKVRFFCKVFSVHKCFYEL